MTLKAELESSKVLALFGELELGTVELGEEYKEEAAEEQEHLSLTTQERKLVSADQFPDQSLLTLDQQLVELRQNLKRLNFYLEDLEDLLPR